MQTRIPDHSGRRRAWIPFCAAALLLLALGPGLGARPAPAAEGQGVAPDAARSTTSKSLFADRERVEAAKAAEHEAERQFSEAMQLDDDEIVDEAQRSLDDARSEVANAENGLSKDEESARVARLAAGHAEQDVEQSDLEVRNELEVQGETGSGGTSLRKNAVVKPRTTHQHPDEPVESDTGRVGTANSRSSLPGVGREYRAGDGIQHRE